MALFIFIKPSNPETNEFDKYPPTRPPPKGTFSNVNNSLMNHQMKFELIHVNCFFYYFIYIQGDSTHSFYPLISTSDCQKYYIWQKKISHRRLFELDRNSRFLEHTGSTRVVR